MRAADEYHDHPVRPYVLTSGRARPSRNTIRPETLLVADPDMPVPVSSGPRHQDLLDVCRGVLSLAEAAAHLKLPVSIVVVIAADLVDAGYLSIRLVAQPDRALLEKVLNGLRNL